MENIKKVNKRESIFNYYVNELKANREDYLLNVIFSYEKNNMFYVSIFKKIGSKPYSNFSFHNEERKNNFVTSSKEKVKIENQKHLSILAHYEEKKKEFKQGVVLCSSWGCEQTNIDFYIILERKNDFVIIQEIGQTRTFDKLGDRGTVIPNATIKTGIPIKKKITSFATLKISSYQSCSLWNGKPKYWSSYA